MNQAEKRSVHTDALATLGTIIDESAGRDAIHLAVEPAIALRDLNPGADIGFIDGKATPYANKLLGIVDPFLKQPVKAGERFWFIVYPRQITSLRHVWSHPDFSDAGPKPSLPVSSEREREIARANLADWARDHDVRPSDLMDTLEQIVADKRSGKRWADTYLRGLSDGETITGEIWSDYEKATGQVIEESAREDWFSCSC